MSERKIMKFSHCGGFQISLAKMSETGWLMVMKCFDPWHKNVATHLVQNITVTLLDRPPISKQKCEFFPICQTLKIVKFRLKIAFFFLEARSFTLSSLFASFSGGITRMTGDFWRLLLNGLIVVLKAFSIEELDY